MDEDGQWHSTSSAPRGVYLKRFESAEEALAAEENYAMAGHRYNTNVGTITELIDAQTRLTEAEVRISRSLADFQTARVKLFFNLGMKNVALK